jgi:hypothetical protein
MKYTIQFNPGGMANTLSPSCLGPNKSGWVIVGKVCEDYYTWVNNFKAQHPRYGIVEGNYESEITASSEEAYKHFNKYHPPQIWDYMDI